MMTHCFHDSHKNSHKKEASKELRLALPNMSFFGLSSEQCEDIITCLGWNTPDYRELLETIAVSAHPEKALVAFYRIWEQIPFQVGQALVLLLQYDSRFRARLFAILGGSSGLADYIAANISSLLYLRDNSLPSRYDMQSAFHDVVEHEFLEHGIVGIGPRIVPLLRSTYRSFLLRIAAHDMALMISSNPIHALEQVGKLLSDLADAALDIALTIARRRIMHGKKEIPPEIAIIAMGKCGARELNYVSDIDIIFVAEPATVRAERIASETISLASLAFCDVDAGLRPEGKNGVLTRTVDSQINYYQKWAKTWEFQALLKARYMCGDEELAQEYLDRIYPLIWEVSLRDNFINDVRSMKRRIEDSVPDDIHDRSLKLGRGGLRDIEFSVQLLQLVHGRMDKQLRVASTLDAIEILTRRGYLAVENGTNLAYSYRFLRLLEHRLQLQQLRRTHILPPLHDYDAMRELARACHITSSGEDVVEVILSQIKKHNQRARAFHKKIFFQPLLDAVIRYDAQAYGLNRESMIVQLEALGFDRPEPAADILMKLTKSNQNFSYNQLRNTNIQLFILPSLLEYVSQTANPDKGLYNYWLLSEKLQGTNWLIRLMRDQPIVAERLMTILGSSEYVASLLIQSPYLIKSYIDTPVGPELLNTSARHAAWAITSHDYVSHTSAEQVINRARKLRHDELTRIASADILGMLTVPEVCSSLSLLRAAVIQSSLSAIIKDMSTGNMTPAKISVIAMGRLGGWELGYGSDADVMFVCDPLPGFTADQAVTWAHKVVEKLRKLLSMPSEDPPLEIDVNLRPEGKNGPLVRTIESYNNYYNSWAEIWEIQALLRANYLAGDYDLGMRFLAMIDNFRHPPHGISSVHEREIQRIKARIDHERLPMGADPMTHTKLGRGGLADIEWTVQLLQLRFGHKIPALYTTSTLDALDVIGASELLPASSAQILKEAWLLVTKTRNALVLAKGKKYDQLPISGEVLAAVAGIVGWKKNDSHGFLNYYLKTTRKVRRVVTRILGET